MKVEEIIERLIQSDCQITFIKEKEIFKTNIGGDKLVLVGTILNGISNMFQDKLINHDDIEFMIETLSSFKEL